MSFSYDLYTNTLTANHAEVVQELFKKLYEKDLIYTRTDDLPYCSHCDRFLPDRFIEGECPHCHFHNARGDQCDDCGKLINPAELVNPKCKICGHTPEWRPSEHFFLKLSFFQKFLNTWVDESTGWRNNAKSFAKKLLKEGLQDRPITRDTTWGIPIPIPGYEEKRIYVWFEAVCGYLSASKEWSVSSDQPDAWRKWWQNPDALYYYVHGKDNIPFHTTIWPAILYGAGDLHLPDRIVSSEYLTLEKKQFSKSRHWAVWAPDFLERFDPETLRFFLVISGPETADADFSWSEYRLRTNGELIGNFGNFINRTLSIVRKNFPDGVRYPEKPTAEQEKFVSLSRSCFSSIGNAIEKGNFRVALKEILGLVEHGNRFFNDVEPWKNVKVDKEKAESDLAVAVQVIRSLAILISPFLPDSSKRIQEQAGGDPVKDWRYPTIEKKLVTEEPTPLYRRIEEEEVAEQLSVLGKPEK